MPKVYRKITVGRDPKDGMKYIVGQEYPVGVIEVIKRRDDNMFIEVFVRNHEGESVMWKDFSPEVPVHGEFDINFNNYDANKGRTSS